MSASLLHLGHDLRDSLVDAINHGLLLLHAQLGLRDALVQSVVLVEREVRSLAVQDKPLLFSLLFVVIFAFLQAQQFILLLFAFDHLCDQSGNVLWLAFALDLTPDLHDGVLDLDLELVLVEHDAVLFWRLSMVVEHVVESDLVVRREQSLLDVLASLLEVSSLFEDSLEAFVGKLEA